MIYFILLYFILAYGWDKLKKIVIQNLYYMRIIIFFYTLLTTLYSFLLRSNGYNNIYIHKRKEFTIFIIFM